MEFPVTMRILRFQKNVRSSGVGITTWDLPPVYPRNAGSRPVCPTANRLGSLVGNWKSLLIPQRPRNSRDAQSASGKAVTLENTEKATGRQPGETGKETGNWQRCG